MLIHYIDIAKRNFVIALLAGCCKQRRFAFLMAVVFLDERPNTQEWIGLGLVTAGVLTLALKR
ncbi:hypothetical protein [Neisseria meningitidis]|uniref:hypothetical protein n=1 Tax=Neisseria meningitidis TaxID=487 RepID=UPI001E45F541|nr:hypothetical protein [Neisseria meningitidis]